MLFCVILQGFLKSVLRTEGGVAGGQWMVRLQEAVVVYLHVYEYLEHSVQEVKERQKLYEWETKECSMLEIRELWY